MHAYKAHPEISRYLHDQQDLHSHKKNLTWDNTPVWSAVVGKGELIYLSNDPATAPGEVLLFCIFVQRILSRPKPMEKKAGPIIDIAKPGGCKLQ